jgi:phytoene dehydrogenase-like protein
MRRFWREFTDHFGSLGGCLRVGCTVTRISGTEGQFMVETRRGRCPARQVVSAVPIELTARLAPPPVARRLAPYLRRDALARGGAIVLFLGVPEDEVAGQEFTHHQLLQDYAAPLGDGNNMFISVSAAGDVESAPTGFRAVMASTHCELGSWLELTPEAYRHRKQEMGERLLSLSRRVYPRLGISPRVYEIGTPRTYERFTHRPGGAVGGVRQTLENANQRAVPHDLGPPGFWLAGDTTWPGLGTVACVLGSRIVAEGVLRRAGRRHVAPSCHLPSHSPVAHACAAIH